MVSPIRSCYIQMLLIIENSGEQDYECSQEWLVNMDLDVWLSNHTIHRITGNEINFFCYLQKIASAMISNLLNASCYSQNEKYDFLLYYCQYH